MAITVHVADGDIRHAEPGDCFRCAVARALQRATGDDEANVYEDQNFELRLEVWSLSIVAPWAVRSFVIAYDGLDRDENDYAVLPAVLEDELAPFTFTLPDQSGTDWQDKCGGCERHFTQGELDEYGLCPECGGTP